MANDHTVYISPYIRKYSPHTVSRSALEGHNTQSIAALLDTQSAFLGMLEKLRYIDCKIGPLKGVKKGNIEPCIIVQLFCVIFIYRMLCPMHWLHMFYFSCFFVIWQFRDYKNNDEQQAACVWINLLFSYSAILT